MSDNLLYEPLEDLVKYVLEHKPHVLILIGPIVDVTHQDIKEANISDPFDIFFEHQIDSLMAKLKEYKSPFLIFVVCIFSFSACKLK